MKGSEVSHPLVSVIIPCYNQAHFVARAIRSCLQGNNLPQEIIVVDDGSVDDVQHAVAEFGEPVRLVRKTNGGLSSARNAGLRAAKGRFLKFLDADDWLLPGSLSRQVACLDQTPESLLITGFRYSFADLDRYDEDHFPNFGLWQASLANGNCCPVHAFLLPRDMALRIGYFDESLKALEDYDYWLRTVLLDFRVLAMHSVECVYFMHEANMSHNHEAMRKASLSVWKRHAKQIVKHSVSPLILAEFLKSGAKNLIQYPDDPSLPEIAELLLGSISSTAKTCSMSEALEIFPALADMTLADPGKAGMNALEGLSLQLLQRLDYRFSELEKHNLQQRLFEIGQRFLQNGQRKIGRMFLQRVQELHTGYGINYRLLSRFQMSLATILPGGGAVAMYLAIRVMFESYWKYLKKFIYGLVCLSKPSGD
jgi:glycosyltransferase involved in cell wall biosynthesis